MKKFILFLTLFFTLSIINAQTIQSMIDAADAGAVITIDEDVYDESITIDKAITLNANGAVTLNVAGNTTGILIDTDVSDVTISGFTIIGDALTGSGITVNPGATNISITNNNIQDILLPGGGNLSPLSYGILCWGNPDTGVNPPTNVTIENNIISNVLGSAISLGSNTENVMISLNSFSNITAVDLVGDGELTSYASIGIQAELSNGLGIQGNTYNGLTISNNLIDCTDVTYVQNNTYINSNLMLSTSFPHSIPFNDTPWWSTTWSDGVNNYEAYYNDPTDLGYLYWVSTGLFVQNSIESGCTDINACNYDVTAVTDDGSCTYPSVYDCDGICINDSDEDSICDEIEVVGCQDDTACNYNALATDAGDCDLAVEGCSTCVDGAAVATDTDGDGVGDCDEVVGCTEPEACNYNADATDAGDCDFAVEGCSTCVDGAAVATDTDGDGVADCDEVLGCTDIEACNYNELATIDDGECLYALGCDSCYGGNDGTGYVLDGDLDNDGICDEFEIYGCDNTEACNYYTFATENDGSCTFPGGACELENDVIGIYNDACECIENNTSIIENNDKKQLLHIINIIGQSTSHRTMNLYIYDDGSIEKKYLLK